MPKPTEVYDWATNTNYAAGPDTGTPTKVQAPTATEEDGWIGNQKPPPQYQNYWQNAVSQWIDWVAQVNDFDSEGNILYSPVKDVRRTMPLYSAQPGGGGTPEWDLVPGSGGPQWESQIDQGALVLSVNSVVQGLSLDGTTTYSDTEIVSVSVFINPGASRSGIARPTLFLLSQGVSGGAPNGSPIESAPALGFGAWETVTLTPASPIAMDFDREYYVEIASGDDGGVHVSDLVSRVMLRTTHGKATI